MSDVSESTSSSNRSLASILVGVYLTAAIEPLPKTACKSQIEGYNAAQMLTADIFAPFTIIEVIGAIVTCIVLILVYRLSAPQVRTERIILIGSSCVVVVLLLSLRFELLPSIEEDERVQTLATTNSESSELYRILSHAPSETTSQLMSDIVQIRMNDLESYFDGLSKGQFVVGWADLPPFLLEMIGSAKSRIIATSYAQPASWWEQPWGKHYEAMNEAAAKRGVKVTRTFLFANQDELNKIKYLLDDEVRAGISVKYAFVDDLHSELVNGLVVVDDNLAGELHLTPTKGVKEAQFYTKRDDIQRIEDRILQVQSNAQEIVPEASRKLSSGY